MSKQYNKNKRKNRKQLFLTSNFGQYYEKVEKLIAEGKTAFVDRMVFPAIVPLKKEKINGK